MAATDTRPPLELDQLVDLEVQLELDQGADPEELRQRDRRIGLALGDSVGDRRALILGWLERVREPGGTPGRRAVQALRIVSFVLIGLGLVTGSGTATGLLATVRPVNVWHFLGVLVITQIALLSLWCIAAMPQLAVLERLQSSLPALAPGRLAPLIGRLMPARTRQGLEVVVGRWAIFDRLYANVRRWQILALSQSFALAFNVGALVTTLALILFTGLEFAWSTTPDSGAALEWIFVALARPWAWALPEAAPTHALIAATRYWPGRGYEDPSGVALASQWWPFLVVALAFYGLLPRLVTAAACRAMLRRSLASIALDHTGYQRLVERLREPLVETRAPRAEELPGGDGDGGAPTTPLDLSGRTATILDWGSVGLGADELAERLTSRFGLPVDGVVGAGGLDPADDDRALERLGTNGGVRAVLVAVKSWEAPTRDLRNFLGELRRRLGDGAPLVVVPIELDEDGRPAAAESADLAQWTRKLTGLGDPWLRVEVLVGGGPRVSESTDSPADGAPAAEAAAPEGPPPVFAVVGHVNKGKSSMVSTLAEDDSVRIEREAGTTVACREFPMRVDGRTLFVLVDTPGFEQARHALAWMRAHETSAADHARVVADFVRQHASSGEFPEECRLLEPILAGAGILYVVDGSRPYSAEYEAEMEILRWTGQPRMALVNRIGPRDHTAEWNAALDQYFSLVKTFDAHRAGFAGRIALLKAFRELRDEWRPPLDATIAALEIEHASRRHRSAQAIADMMADALTLVVSERLPLDGDPEPLKEGLKQRFRDELRARERRGRDRVERIYQHTRLDRREGGLELVEDDLFAESIWLRLGLSRTQLVATGALGGAIAGGAIDAAVGGASMFTGTLIGAAAGAGAGWFTQGQLARVKVLGQAMGGKLLQIGPVRDPQFPWVLLDRALLHHRMVSERSHAVRDPFVVGAGERAGVVGELDARKRRELTTCFARLRRSIGIGGGESARAGMTSAVEELIAGAEPTV